MDGDREDHDQAERQILVVGADLEQVEEVGDEGDEDDRERGVPPEAASRSNSIRKSRSFDSQRKTVEAPGVASRRTMPVSICLARLRTALPSLTVKKSTALHRSRSVSMRL